MKRYSLLSLVAIISFTTLKAQESQTLYVNKYDKYVDNLDSAEFIRVLKAPDSGSTLFGVLEYNKNGKLKSVGYCKNPSQIQYEGQLVCFHPNGKRKSTGYYNNGKITDVEYLFYPNGRLYLSRTFKYDKKDVFLTKPKILVQSVLDSAGKVLFSDGNGYYIEYSPDFKNIEAEGMMINSKWDGVVKGCEKTNNSSYTETYKNGKLVSGVSTDTTGKTYPYTQLDTRGDFEDVPYSFEKLLGKKIYSVAREKKLKGKTFVSFTIDNSGRIQSPKIDRSLDKDLDKQILVFLNSGLIFKPSLHRGIPTTTRYNIPIGVDFDGTSNDPFSKSENPRNRELGQY